MIHHRQSRSLVPMLASVALLAACASTPTRFFTLDPIAPAQPVASGYAGPALRVLAVHIPPLLDREELVQESGPGEIKVHDFEHWSAPLGLTARQVLIQDLAARLPSGEVLGPDSPAGPHVAALSIDVVAFRSGPSEATMQVSWTATLPAGSGMAEAAIVLRSPLQQLQGPAGAAADGSGTAQAFSALLAQLSDQIAATLPMRMQEALTQQGEREAAAQAYAAAAARVQTTTRTQTVTMQQHAASPF